MDSAVCFQLLCLKDFLLFFVIINYSKCLKVSDCWSGKTGNSAVGNCNGLMCLHLALCEHLKDTVAHQRRVE